MRKLTLKEIQGISLDILKNIHTFCKENGISYSVIGGTLLGAVRHKGFIPWDDDVDVMMPRGDYEKFCKQYSSDRYRLISFENDKSCMIAFARVCDMNDTVVSEQSWTGNKVGVWIDIFPFDGAEDDFAIFSNSYQKISKVWRSTYRERAFYLGESPSNTKKLNLAIKMLNYCHLGWAIKIIARQKVKFIKKKSMKIKYGTTNSVSQYAFCHPGTKEYYPFSAFRQIIEVPFEDTTVCAIAGYNEYLSRFYGDYMTLPPVEKQVPKQDYLHFYWRTDDRIK